MTENDIAFWTAELGFVAFFCVILCIFAYNKMVECRQLANQAFADMDVLLKKRRDLIPNLVSTVKGSSAHEIEALGMVVRLRAQATSAVSIQDKLATDRDLTGALGQFFALSEAYPDLKANANFLDLQGRLNRIEDELSEARQSFNLATANYNTEREKIPTVFVASALGFKPYTFFDVGASQRSELDVPPSVSF